MTRLLLATAITLSFTFAMAASKKVSFIYPKDGTTVPSKFKAKFAVHGMRLVPAGQSVDDKNSGHFHLLIDAPAVPENQVIPADSTHLHYGKAQTESSELALTPGKHTLTLEFADGLHRAYAGDLVKTITVNVK